MNFGTDSAGGAGLHPSSTYTVYASKRYLIKMCIKIENDDLRGISDITPSILLQMINTIVNVTMENIFELNL